MRHESIQAKQWHLTSALDKSEWFTSNAGRFNPWKETWYPIGDWIDPQIEMDVGEKTFISLPGFERQIVQPVVAITPSSPRLHENTGWHRSHLPLEV
jgi:hypothetical protein